MIAYLLPPGNAPDSVAHKTTVLLLNYRSTCDKLANNFYVIHSLM